MVKIPDISKLGDKSKLQEIINSVKSMIGTTPIPEASKDDPTGYLLSELSKTVKELADLLTKQSTEVANLNNLLGTLSQELIALKKTTPAEPTAAKVESKTEAKASEEVPPEATQPPPAAAKKKQAEEPTEKSK